PRRLPEAFCLPPGALSLVPDPAALGALAPAGDRGPVHRRRDGRQRGGALPRLDRALRAAPAAAGGARRGRGPSPLAPPAAAGAGLAPPLLVAPPLGVRLALRAGGPGRPLGPSGLGSLPRLRAEAAGRRHPLA